MLLGEGLGWGWRGPSGEGSLRNHRRRGEGGRDARLRLCSKWEAKIMSILWSRKEGRNGRTADFLLVPS